MKVKVIKIRVWLLLSFLLSSIALGQEPKQKPATVRFVAQVLPKNMGKIMMRVEDKDKDKIKESDPFDLPVNNLTPTLKAPGRLFSLALSTGTKPTIATVKLPAEGSSFIVLLLAIRNDGYDAVVLPASGASFRPGDVYLHNTSKTPVLGQIGNKRFVIKPGTGKIHKPTGAIKNTYFDVMFLIKEKNGKNRFLTTSRWPVTDRTRSYIFFFKDPSSERIRFRAVDEFIPKAK